MLPRGSTLALQTSADGSGALSSVGRNRWLSLLWTGVALLAFAGNSILCRQALLPSAEGLPQIDPGLFTSVRLASGALLLLPVLLCNHRNAMGRTNPASAVALALYAIGFSLSYVTLQAGVGALLLFGAVQITMAGVGWFRGDRLRGWRALGMGVAMAGLVFLVLPAGLALDAPDPVGVVLMVGAGVAWGVYSLLGRGSRQPMADTARNFLWAVPLSWTCLLFSERQVTAQGVYLAVASGAVTSALGYSVWYAALRGLSATQAGLAQLTVPILAAAGGVVFLGEPVTSQLVVCGAAVLGGVCLGMLNPKRKT